jgi:hypothetical protein
MNYKQTTILFEQMIRNIIILFMIMFKTKKK